MVWLATGGTIMFLRAMLDKRVVETTQNDGAGGKPQFFTLVGTPEAFRMLGWEVIVMCNDDVACGGGLPVVFSSNLDIKEITAENLHLCEALMSGFAKALAASGTVLITGETAVMRHSITAFCDRSNPAQLIVNWAGTCLGLMRTDRPPNGSTIRPGMAVVGLGEDGYRCNGGTALTNLLLQTWGPRIEDVLASQEAMEFANQLVIPSRSYARMLSYLTGWQNNGIPGDPVARIHGMAHITGGGVWNKFRELLPVGVGANLHNMLNPPEVLLRAQELSYRLGGEKVITDKQCYGTFHGGCGALLVVDPQDADLVCWEASNFGHRATVVGETTESIGNEVVIQSRFLRGKLLSSLHE